MLFMVACSFRARGLFPGSGAGFGVCAGYAGRAPSSTRPSASSQRITAPSGLAAARARLGPTALFFYTISGCRRRTVPRCTALSRPRLRSQG